MAETLTLRNARPEIISISLKDPPDHVSLNTFHRILNADRLKWGIRLPFRPDTPQVPGLKICDLSECMDPQLKYRPWIKYSLQEPHLRAAQDGREADVEEEDEEEDEDESEAIQVAEPTQRSENDDPPVQQVTSHPIESDFASSHLYLASVQFGSVNNMVARLAIDTGSGPSWVYAYHFNLLPPKEERENKELEDDAVDIQTLGFTTRELRYGNAHKGLVIPGLRRKLRNFKLVPITRVLEYRDQSAIAITDVVVNMKFMGGQAQDLILPRLNFLAAIAADFRVIKRGYDGVLGFSPAVTGNARKAAPLTLPFFDQLYRRHRLLPENDFHLWFSPDVFHTSSDYKPSQLFLGGFPKAMNPTIEGKWSSWLKVVQENTVKSFFSAIDSWALSIQTIILRKGQTGEVVDTLHPKMKHCVFDTGTAVTHFNWEIYEWIRNVAPDCFSFRVFQDSPLSMKQESLYCDIKKLQNLKLQVEFYFDQANPDTATIIVPFDELAVWTDSPILEADYYPCNFQSSGREKHSIWGVKGMRGLAIGHSAVGSTPKMRFAKIKRL